MSLLDKVLRVGEGKNLRELEEFAARVNALEPDFERLDDAELQSKTPEYRERLANGASLDDLAVEAFATVRETVYLNALEGNGVHVVTVNDYLAARDAEWMGSIHRFLGLEIGVIKNGMQPAERKQAYDADITHGTNNEFGFDYLRDNMAMRVDNMVQRGHHYAIVDEVESIGGFGRAHRESQVLGDRELPEDFTILGDVADALLDDPVRRHPEQFDAVERDRPGAGEQPQHRQEGGRLAGAVAAQEGGDPVGQHVERHTVEDVRAGTVDIETPDLDQRRHCLWHRSSRRHSFRRHRSVPR